MPESAEAEAFGDLLTRALRPVDAPPGFADAVLRRAGAADTDLVSAPGVVRGAGSGRAFGKLFPWPAALWQGSGALAAAALAVAVFAGEQTHLRHVQESDLAKRRASANQQFEASVRIMDRTLEQTRQQLRQAGVAGVE